MDDLGEVGKNYLIFFFKIKIWFFKVYSFCSMLKCDEPLASVTSGSSARKKLFIYRIYSTCKSTWDRYRTSRALPADRSGAADLLAEGDPSVVDSSVAVDWWEADPSVVGP
jgi:hypothetical protein